MRKRLHQYIEEMGEKRENEVTTEDEVFHEQWQSPVHLAQEMNKELYELNAASEAMYFLARKMSFWVKTGGLLLVVITLTLLFVAFRI